MKIRRNIYNSKITMFIVTDFVITGKLDRISAIDLHVLKDMEVFWRENAHKYYYNRYELC